MFVEAKFFHKAGEGSGGGGGDSHNKGSFLTPEALRTAYPTAEPGDFAIVESTDTVWVWDSDGSQWKDADQKGQVTSVNNKTGAVTLTASDVGAATAAQGAKADTAIQSVKTINSQSIVGTGNVEIDGLPSQTGHSGQVLTTDGFVAGWVKPEIVQVSALPVASEDEVDNIYQFVGTTDANYTNGYFYKCVSDGQNPATYSWTQTDVQPQAGGLPSQTGNAGKFLTTDGTDASWGSALANNNSSWNGLSILGVANSVADSITVGYQAKSLTDGVVIGNNAEIKTAYVGSSVVIGNNANATGNSYQKARQTIIGNGANGNGYNAVALGYSAKALADNTIQLGPGTNSDAGTFKVGNLVGNTWNNFTMMNADGTIPKERLTNVVTTPSTAPVLAVADWSSNTQTITVTGITATNTVFVAPAPASAADYAAAGILCTAQAADSLTFTCTTVPSNAITLSVVILG